MVFLQDPGHKYPCCTVDLTNQEACVHMRKQTLYHTVSECLHLTTKHEAKKLNEYAKRCLKRKTKPLIQGREKISFQTFLVNHFDSEIEAEHQRMERDTFLVLFGVCVNFGHRFQKFFAQQNRDEFGQPRFISATEANLYSKGNLICAFMIHLCLSYQNVQSCLK